MHTHLAYPTSLPYDDLMFLINGVRKGTLFDDKTEGIKAVWCLSGYAALMSVGEPTAPPPPSPAIHASSAPKSDAEIMEALESYASAQREANPNVVQALNVPWAQVLKWAAQLLLTVL